MTETARTAAFAAVAAVAVLLAAVLSWPGPTPETVGFEQVGTPFFTAFDASGNAAESEAAAGILSKIGKFKITAFDADTGAIQDFRIARNEETGLYGIAPYDYPAEAAEKLAEIAAALGSAQRTALQSRRESDWADLGVVDPASEDVAQLEGRGLRIELTGDDGNTLADLIVGNAVEGRDGYFYVREPRDNSTYIAKLADLGLSASFADWVDPQVLEVAAADFRRIVVPDETIDPQAGELIVGDELVLSREDAAGEWTAERLPEGRSVDQAKANALARTAAGLTIVGVRPKPDGLEPDLTLDPAVVRSQAQYQAIVRDVTGKGFAILPTDDGGGQVIGEAGQLTVATDAGVAYDLDFGELFTGTTYDFAVGDAGEGYKTLQAKNDDAQDGDDGADDESTDEEEESQGRYLFVTARVDAAALGEPPVEPEAPAEPAAGEAESGSDEAENGAEENADGEADSAQAQYEQDLAAYRTAKTAYDKRAAAAAERVEELNRRFGDWYYVVDAEDVAELSLTPAALLVNAPPALPSADGSPSAETPPQPGGTPAPVETPGNLQDLINGLSPGMDAGDAPSDEDAPENEAPAEPMESPAPGEASPAAPPNENPPAEDSSAEGEDRSPVTAPRPTPTDPSEGASGDGETDKTDPAKENGGADDPADGGADGDE